MVRARVQWCGAGFIRPPYVRSWLLACPNFLQGREDGLPISGRNLSKGNLERYSNTQRLNEMNQFVSYLVSFLATDPYPT